MAQNSIQEPKADEQNISESKWAQIGEAIGKESRELQETYRGPHRDLILQWADVCYRMRTSAGEFLSYQQTGPSNHISRVSLNETKAELAYRADLEQAKSAGKEIASLCEQHGIDSTPILQCLDNPLSRQIHFSENADRAVTRLKLKLAATPQSEPHWANMRWIRHNSQVTSDDMRTARYRGKPISSRRNGNKQPEYLLTTVELAFPAKAKGLVNKFISLKA